MDNRWNLVPEQLRGLPRWVCHRYPQSKAPLSPLPGPDGRLGPASCADRTTWGSFPAAVKALDYGATGIGIQLGDGLVGVDIDHCADGGELSPLAREVIETLGSYTEFSPSGEGIHVLCRGRLPAGCRNRDSLLGLEVYEQGRYFTVTGNAYLDPQGRVYPFRDCTGELARLCEKYLAERQGEQLRLGHKSPPPPAQSGPGEPPRAELSDRELLEIAFRSKGGDALRRLYTGTYTPAEVPCRADGTPDASALDLSLCNSLAFWCNGDAGRIDRLFRASALYRPKWDQRRGSATYGEKTIRRALAGLREGFSSAVRPQDGQGRPPLPEPPPGRTTPPAEPPAPAQQGDWRPDPGRYTLDDTGNAYRFRDAYGEDLRYDHVNRSWYRWTGQRWEPDQTGAVKRLANRLLEGMEHIARESGNGELMRHVRRTRSSKYKEAMLREAQPLEGIPILPDQLDRYGSLFCCPNGVLDLKTGELLPHRRELYLTMLGAAPYDPQAACPRWEQFLREITQADEELAVYLQRMAGYCLTGSTAEQCVFFLFGAGGNGKSKFIETLKEVMGDYAKTCDPEVVMVRPRGGGNAPSAELARMKGVRLLATSEPDGGCRLAEGLVKRMTGEDAITARRLYQESFEFKPEFKILMATNVKPVISGTDQGIWRRIRLIPFTAHFAPHQIDRDLGEKLLAEREGIFRWMVQGAVDWYRLGMPACRRVDSAVQDYRGEMDRLGQFVEDCLQEQPGARVASGKVYEAYLGWCSQQGERYPVSNRKLSQELRDNYGFTRCKTAASTVFLDLELTGAGVALLEGAPLPPPP